MSTEGFGQTLQNHYVRDLHWALTAQDMMLFPEVDCFEFSDQEALQGWLMSLDATPDLLEAHMAESNLFLLGTYFEALWEFFLRHSPWTTLVAKNVQVFRDRQTLGEFDFIYLCHRQNRHYHLEVAVKYYLGVPDRVAKPDQPVSSQDCWLGPMCNDRLDIKYSKLLDKQLKLSKTLEGKDALKKYGLDEVISQVCLKGELYYPVVGGAIVSPENALPDHRRGNWLRQSSLREFVVSEKFEGKQACMLEKPFWLAFREPQGANILNGVGLLEVVEEYFRGLQKPLLLAVAEQGNWTEQKRYFICPDHWPFASGKSVSGSN